MLTRGQRDYAKNSEKYKARAKAFRAANLEKVKEKSRTYCSRPEIKERRRLRTYGLTRETYQALLDMQGNGCAICFTSFTVLNKRHIHIDHEHLSGIVRGVLCHTCNLGIGNFKDDPRRLEVAASYLRRFKS